MSGRCFQKLILIEFAAALSTFGLPVWAVMPGSSLTDQHQPLEPTLLTCGGGGSDSERRPKRPGHHAKPATDSAVQADIKP